MKDRKWRAVELRPGLWAVVDEAGEGPWALYDDKETAVLVATTPDLLAALRGLTDAAFTREITMGDPITLLRVKAELEAAVKVARAVIAQAEGRMPFAGP